MAPRRVNTKQMSLTHSRMIVAEAFTASIAEDPRLLMIKMKRLARRAMKPKMKVAMSSSMI
jgi:hypothetical protein